MAALEPKRSTLAREVEDYQSLATSDVEEGRIERQPTATFMGASSTSCEQLARTRAEDHSSLLFRDFYHILDLVSRSRWNALS